MSENSTQETKVISTKTEERLNWLSNKTKKFLNSNWSFVFFIALFSLFTIAQIIYDWQTGNLTKNKELELNLIIFAGSVTWIMSLIYSARIQARFFVYIALSLVFWIWRSVIVGLPFNSAKLLILFIPSILRFVKWSKGNKENKEIEIRRMKSWYFISMFIVLTAFVLLFGKLADGIESESLPYVDVGNFIFGIVGAVIVAYGYIEGWFISIISLTFGMLSYVFLSTKGLEILNINGIGSMLVFIILSFGTILAWMSIYHSKQHTFKYVPKIKKIENENEHTLEN